MRIDDRPVSPEIPSRISRGVRIIRVASWASLLIGVVASTGAADSRLVAAAVLLGGAFVVPASTVRIESLAPPGLKMEIFSLSGAVLTIAATALTGGVNSPFVLLAMMPSLLAAMVGGARVGLTTSLLSGGLLTAVSASEIGFDAVIASSSGVIGLFPLMALLVAQIRSLLLEAEERASTLEKVTADAEARLLRLEQANEMLRRLTDLYGEGTTNPVDVGRSAIEAMVESYPGSFATATLFDASGPVVVARAGSDAADLVKTQIPLGYGPTTSGVVSIGTPKPMTPDDLEDIQRLLQPVGVSFANAVLMQEIAGEAIREERLRLARELHDEIGPALSAVAISLDAVAMQIREQEPKEQVADIRMGLGSVVDDLRAIIADLRAEESGAMLAALRSGIADLAPPPEVHIAIHERRPPRVAAGRQILAIVTEAVRNAHRHAGAQAISVEGTVDRSEVAVTIRDDGSGFDPNQLPEGHYGIMGMRERADRIGAAMEILSDAKGTLVRINWKEGR
jgi:signal transduction histidine kinase